MYAYIYRHIYTELFLCLILNMEQMVETVMTIVLGFRIV